MQLNPTDIQNIIVYKSLGKGSYGTVYPTIDDDIVVKVISLTTDIDFRSAATELAVLECIKDEYPYKLLGYGYTETKMYLVLPRCKPIPDNYDSFKLHTELRSCLQILHRKGIAHADISKNNVMLYQDKAILIDFSLSKFCIPTNDGDHVFTGLAYSESLIDPEFLPDSYNSIRCDLYALGMTLHHYGYYDTQKYLCKLDVRKPLAKRKFIEQNDNNTIQSYIRTVKYLYYNQSDNHYDIFNFITYYGKYIVMSRHEPVNCWLKMSLPMFIKSNCWKNNYSVPLVYRHSDYLCKLDMELSQDIYAHLYNKKYKHLPKLVHFNPYKYTLNDILRLNRNPFTLNSDDVAGIRSGGIKTCANIVDKENVKNDAANICSQI